VVFHDHLVTQPVLELVRRDAELICVGKRAGEHSVPQHETNQLLVEAAKAGKTVVRLKGGDPFIFGRGAKSCRLPPKRASRSRWCRASLLRRARRPTPVFR
jgi:siroheme synthase